MKQYRQLLTLILLFCSGYALAQDVIVKKDGSTIVCRVMELNDTEIVYKKWSDLNGTNYVMERSSASSINYEDGKKDNLAPVVENRYEPNNQSNGEHNLNDNALIQLDKDLHHAWMLKFKAKIGLSIDNLMGGSDDIESKIGYDVTTGLNFYPSNSHWALGANFSFSSYGGKNKSNNKVFNFKGFGLSPFVGYKIPINHSYTLIPYIGPIVCWLEDRHVGGYEDPTASLFIESRSYTNGGFCVGFDFFISSHIFINLQYIQLIDAKINERDYEFGNGDLGSISATKLSFSIGYQF